MSEVKEMTDDMREIIRLNRKLGFCLGVLDAIKIENKNTDIDKAIQKVFNGVKKDD